MAQSIITNAGVATGGRLINAALGVFITGLLTRLFGPAHFGTYTLLLSYGALLQLMADFGLYLTLTREIGHDKSRSDILSQVFSLRAALLILVYAAGGLLAGAVPSLAPWQYPFLFAAAGLFFQSLSQLLMGVFQKYGVVWRATVGDFIGRAGQIIGIVLLGRVAVGVVAMVGSFSVGAAAALAAHYLFLPHKIRVRPIVSWSVWRGLLQTSWPLGAMLLLNAIYFRIDTIILSFFRSAAEVGHYGLAYRVIESGLFFPAMFGGLLLPQLSRAWQQRHLERCQRLITEGLRILAVSSVFCLLVLLLLSREAILVLAGPEFLPAAPLLQLLSVALAIMFFGNLFGFTLVAINRQKNLLYIYAALALVNTIANYAFIPRYGALAAAMTTVSTEALAMLAAAWLVYRLVGYVVSIRFVIRLGFCAVATAVIMSSLRSQLDVVSLLVVGTLFYGAVCWQLGVVSKQDIALLMARSFPS